ncbi:hypothetical protein [Mycobacterium hubeiense]|uniref:hypothetical protein n=1 Tax=Mycobacterium hubeiense TaxID=1867256 RepID=UPI00115AA45C|nr:hypothetical protein [Mycobacterium sp. QGD 101]
MLARDTDPVSYCPATNSVGIDMPGLAERGAKADEVYNPTVTGDFSAYVLVGSRFALAAQKQKGESLRGANAALRSACYAGAWATGLASGAAGDVSLSPGDLDEALSGLLTDGVVASDVDGVTVPSGFERVDAFKSGVLDGLAECRARYAE